MTALCTLHKSMLMVLTWCALCVAAVQSDKAASQLTDLLVTFMKDGALKQEEALAGLQGLTSQLADLA